MYENFKTWALANGFKKELEIDRIDNNKGYFPENCRFVPKIINTSNRSNTIYINYNGEEISLTLFVLNNNISKERYKTIRRRLMDGWDAKSAIEVPIKKTEINHGYAKKIIDNSNKKTYKSLKEAAIDNNLHPSKLCDMLKGRRKNTTSLSYYLIKD